MSVIIIIIKAIMDGFLNIAHYDIIFLSLGQHGFSSGAIVLNSMLVDVEASYLEATSYTA